MRNLNFTQGHIAKFSKETAIFIPLTVINVRASMQAELLPVK